MAVKHGCRDSADESRLNNIKRVLETIEQQKQCSGGSERVALCAKIVTNLGMVAVPSNPMDYKNFMEHINKLTEILINTIVSQDMIVATLHALYNEISNVDKKPSPTMSIVLFLLDQQQIPKAVNVILHTGCQQESKLEQALNTLCTWLSRWTLTPSLGPLVYELMNGLESEQHYDILINITILHIERLFRLLIIPDSRQYIGPVVLRMLSCMQHSPEAFHKIIPHVPQVVESLEKENTDSSIDFQQRLLTLCVTLLDHFPDYPINEQLSHTLKQYNAPASCKFEMYKSWSESVNTTSQLSYLPGKVGLNNLGNTCYMNSVLQALFMTKTFRNDVIQSTGAGIPIYQKLQALFALLQYSERSALSPSDIANIARPPGFQPGHQHDSSEFLGYLLDVLHEQEKSVLGSNHGAGASAPSSSTVVKTSFGGTILSVSLCNRCHGQSERYDTFRDLQLSFPNTSENQSVQTLIDYYLQPEKLSGDNQYHCDFCKGLTDGERVTRIIDPPQRLLLTLKHFRYDPATQLRTKILQRVQLDNSILVHQTQYQLYAAVVHCGSSVDSGHYYTYAQEDDEWYKFNDCFVHKSSATELCSLRPPEAPYILFYRRADCTDPETLNKMNLSQELLTVLVRDAAEFNAERRKPQQPISKFGGKDRNRHNRNDDPPPPGCGGGGFIDSSHNRYVC